MLLKIASLAVALAATGLLPAQSLPSHVPPKRSSQIQNGFGINSDLPRAPYLPWDRWWWTRMFDAGVSWIRIGQYENSSDPTSWDWVEQKRGVFAVAPEVDDYVDSLIENGVKVQVQLMYGNPMYTSPAGKKPDAITPEPGRFHNDDRSIDSVFWPPTTPDQIAAFMRYVQVDGEPFPRPHPLLRAVERAGHRLLEPVGQSGRVRPLAGGVRARGARRPIPQAKVIYGGQADPGQRLGQARARRVQVRARDRCLRLSHLSRLRPEPESGVDGYGAYGPNRRPSCATLVRNYPGHAQRHRVLG